jgi:SM-20-related protein
VTIDIQRFQSTPLVLEPFRHLIVSGFLKQEALEAINADYPKISQSGSFPVGDQKYGRAFGELLDELRGPEMRRAFEKKFDLDLTGRPTMITVRGRCSPKDGRIHTDSETKIITVLIYMNPSWEQSGGRLRLLRSADNLDDVIAEVPPVAGTLLAFLRSDNSFHGHKPFAGERRVIQLNWVTSQAVVDRETKRHRFSAWTKKLKSLFGG